VLKYIRLQINKLILAEDLLLLNEATANPGTGGTEVCCLALPEGMQLSHCYFITFSRFIENRI
jgi:hypothetical protein